MKMLIMTGRFRVLCAALFLFVLAACEKSNTEQKTVYYEVAMKNGAEDWRDSSFVVATSNASLISKIDAQLKLPAGERKMVSGTLLAGSAGYNKNASHEFKWHFDETDWNLADFSIEVGDGRLYSDVDSDTAYWIHNVKRFSPWNSYIRAKIPAID